MRREVEVMPAKLRPAGRRVIGGSARAISALALICNAVPARLAGRRRAGRMRGDARPRRAAAPGRRPLWGACVALGLAALVLIAVGPGRVPPSDIFAGAGGAAFVLLALTFATVGALVARRAPGNRIGWIFLLAGLANAAQVLTWSYADVGLHAGRHLAGAPAAAVINQVISEETAGLLGIALLLFPDGRLPSRRWRPALACLLAGIVLLVLADTVRPGPYEAPFASVTNPFGLGSRSALSAVDLAGLALCRRRPGRRRARRW